MPFSADRLLHVGHDRRPVGHRRRRCPRLESETQGEHVRVGANAGVLEQSVPTARRQEPVRRDTPLIVVSRGASSKALANDKSLDRHSSLTNRHLTRKSRRLNRYSKAHNPVRPVRCARLNIRLTYVSNKNFTYAGSRMPRLHSAERSNAWRSVKSGDTESTHTLTESH